MPTRAAKKSCGFMEMRRVRASGPERQRRGAFRPGSPIASRESPVRGGEQENVSRREMVKQMAGVAAL